MSNGMTDEALETLRASLLSSSLSHRRAELISLENRLKSTGKLSRCVLARFDLGIWLTVCHRKFSGFSRTNSGHTIQYLCLIQGQAF